MNYYKDTEDKVYGFEDDEQMNLYHPGLTKMTEAEFEAFRNPPPSFEQLQEAKLAEINVAFSDAASALTAGYPEAERMTWATQQAEIMAWNANNNIPTPYLDGLAEARGISPEEMRQKTLEQTQLFLAASQSLVGKRQRLRDAAYTATTKENLEAITWDEQE